VLRPVDDEKYCSWVTQRVLPSHSVTTRLEMLSEDYCTYMADYFGQNLIWEAEQSTVGTRHLSGQCLQYE